MCSNLNYKYFNVDMTYYVEEENTSNKEEAVCVRDIQSVSDYIRAISLILSNRFILDTTKNLPIKRYENMFSTQSGIALRDIRRLGLFFRGENKDYKYQMPGLFRKKLWIENEDKIVKSNQITSPEELKKAKSIFDILTLIQHYGGCSRILDVTTNALVALFFAVSGNFNKDDGFVYILTANRRTIGLANILNNIKEVKSENVLSPNDKEVIVKAALSLLNIKQKRFLSHYLEDAMFNNSKNRYGRLDQDEDIKTYFERLGVVDETNAVSDLYTIVEKNLGVAKTNIKIKDIYGYNFVQPYRVDKRIIQQAGAFIIFGLEDFEKADNLYELYSENDNNYHELKGEVEELTEKIKSDIDTKGETEPCCVELKSKFENAIKNYRSSCKKDKLEYVCQRDASVIINNLGVLYSPENQLVTKMKKKNRNTDSQGIARIQIRQQYKKRILDELDMLGINESTIYPDMQHKTREINNEYGMPSSIENKR